MRLFEVGDVGSVAKPLQTIGSSPCNSKSAIVSHFTGDDKLTISRLITILCRGESCWAVFASSCVLPTSISIVFTVLPQILQIVVRLFEMEAEHNKVWCL